MMRGTTVVRGYRTQSLTIRGVWAGLRARPQHDHGHRPLAQPRRTSCRSSAWP